MLRAVAVALVGLVIGLPAVEADDAERTGGLSGRIEFTTRPRTVIPLGPAPVFAAPVRDESLVGDPKTHGLANVFVYMRTPPAVIPNAVQAVPNLPFKTTIREGRFHPHLAFIRVGQPVVVENEDARAQGVSAFLIKNRQANAFVHPGRTAQLTDGFGSAEILPCRVSSAADVRMSAYWLILDHPYATVTDAKGRFEIHGLPPGRHSFRLWHERAGYLERSVVLEVEPGETTDVGTRTYGRDEFE